MSLTLEEIKYRLKQMDEITLLELLEITSEDLVDRFEDWIENKEDYFVQDLEDEDWEEF